MILDLQQQTLDYATIYDAPPMFTTNGVDWRVRRKDGLLYWDFEGTKDLKGWLSNFQALARKHVEHALLGPLHPGFDCGMDQVVDAFIPHREGKQEPIIIAGHSRGAAHATLAAALLSMRGVAPAAVLCWGCPRPGMQKLRSILSGTPGVKRSFQNKAPGAPMDPVTSVPAWLWPFEQYVDPLPLIRVEGDPGNAKRWGLLDPEFHSHHIEGYAAALKGMKLEIAIAETTGAANA